MSAPEYVPPWEFTFRTAPCRCLCCGSTERSVIVVSNQELGVCEACAVHLHWTWKLLSGDAPPSADDADQSRVGKIKIVIARRRKLEDKSLAPADHPESYELVMASDEDGLLDFPTAELGDGGGEDASIFDESVGAVVRKLYALGLVTWPCHVESLYMAHTPRGRLARVMLVTAYSACRDEKALQWRAWPPWEHAKHMATFYRALEDVWSLRICKHLSQGPRTESITTCVREGAARYIAIQQRLRRGEDVDTSMLEYLRKSMTDDEKLVDRQVADYETKVVEVRAEQVQVPAGEQEEPATSDDGGEQLSFSDVEVSESGPDDADDSTAGEDADDDVLV